jgi:CRP/FNR family transcriptional regulator, anaerobic regulatory protein
MVFLKIDKKMPKGLKASAINRKLISIFGFKGNFVKSLNILLNIPNPDTYKTNNPIPTMKASLEKYLTNNSHLTKAERDIILDSFVHVNIPKKKLWIKKGEVCGQMAFVVSGIMRIINELDDSPTTMQFVFKDMFTTSLTSYAYQIPGNWTIEAVTDCDLLVINRHDHFRLLNEYKSWLEVDNVLLLQAYTELEYRIFSQFHLSSEQRFKKLFQDRPEIFNQVPLKHIASFLGITPETLSRLRKKHLH